jgi:hypothetical protein
VNLNQFQSNGALTRSLTSGASTITIASGGTGWQVSGSGFTFTMTGSTINAPGGSFTFAGGGATYGTLNLNSSGSPQGITGANTFANLNLTVNGVQKATAFQLAANQTITGTLKYLGNSAVNRMLIQSDIIGTPRTLTAAAINAASDFADWMDITAAGAAAPFATGTSVGDCGGNTSITATTPATQTWGPDASGNWSAAGNWTSRVPLPQDAVIINRAFTAGRTITADMPRLGKSITCSPTGTPTIALTSLGVTAFGSIDLTGVSTGTPSQLMTLAGRAASTLKSAGNSFQALTIAGFGATLTLQDALTCTAGLSLTAGGFNDGGFAVQAASWSNAGSITRSVTRSSTWTLTGSGTVVSVATAGLTSTDTGTLKLTDASASTKTFAGGGGAFGTVWLAGAGTGDYQFTGSNTFNTFKADAGRNIKFTAGTTQNITNWQANGAPGNVNTIGSITGASHTLNFTQNPGHVDADYLSISRSTATPANWWFAGAHSTDGGNNSGWVFADYVGMVGAANVIATVAPQLSTSILLQGADQALTNWTGSLGTAIICRGDVQAAAAMAGAIVTQIPLAGSLLEQVAMLGNLSKNEGEVFTVPRQTRTFRV